MGITLGILRRLGWELRALKTFASLLLGVCLIGLGPSHRAWARLEASRPALTYLDLRVPQMPEARLFSVHLHGIDVVGAETGPTNGHPVLMVGGYSTSFPYQRKLMRELAAIGYRVFVYNPPGQGLGQLRSGRDAQAEHLGINGMLAVYPEMRRLVYELSGRRKVVVLGHSLGGFQIRMGSLGVVNTLAVQARFDDRSFVEARSQTALLVPMFSFGVLGEEIWAEARRRDVLLLKDVLPALTYCAETIGCVLPEFFKGVVERFAANYLAGLQNSLHQGLFGVDDLDHEELGELARYLFPQNISAQIRDDLARWLKEQAFSTTHGLDLGARWEQVQQSRDALPVLYVVGKRDGLTVPEPFKREAEMLPRAGLIEVDSGHMGAYISKNLPRTLAQAIYQKHQALEGKNCLELLSSVAKKRR